MQDWKIKDQKHFWGMQNTGLGNDGLNSRARKCRTTVTTLSSPQAMQDSIVQPCYLL